MFDDGMGLAKEGESLFDAINPLQDNMDDDRMDQEKLFEADDGEDAFGELIEQNKLNSNDVEMGMD